jgi:predicted nucleic acid-binding protein
MRYLIDSNLFLYAAAKEKLAVAFLDSAIESEWAGYSTISRLELFGFPDLKKEDEGKLKDLLGCFSELGVTTEVVDRAIEIRRERRRIKVPDAIVAASALVMNAKLVTRNADDFKNIKGIQVVNPFRV